MKLKLTVVAGLLLCGMLSIFGMGKLDKTANQNSLYLNNVGVTSCWTGTCGHKSKTYSYPSYTQSGRTTSYYYTGYYLDPGVSQTVSFSKTVSQSISFGGEVGSSTAKASVGFTGGTSYTASVSQTITNSAKCRQYAHIGVEMANRGNTVTVKNRTYYPFYHLTAVNKYCQYSTSYSAVTAKVVTGRGLSLLSYIRNY